MATTSKPVSAHDVAAYILDKCGPITAMKLQKLLYYSQAWSLVWDEAPLFNETIEAWANGPVVRSVYERHRGQFLVSKWEGDASALSDDQRETVDIVLAHYGQKPAQYLSDLTHRERPWSEAREGLDEGTRGDKEISPAAMAEYYGSL
jgi:uncharacterized phage-associated protein